MDLKSAIRKYALQNAIKFNGKANPKALIGRLLGEFPEWRNKSKELVKEIENIVEDVNELKPDKQLEELKSSAPELLEEKKVESKPQLPELKDVKKVVMRFAPSPSGPLHIGHAYVLSLNSELCKKYKGNLIIRIEDTNPENINPDSYKFIEEDANWLTKNKVSKVITQSERLEIYYKYAEKLINLGEAYICTCNPDEFKTLIFKKKACPCRDLPKKEQSERYNKLFKGYNEGEAVMRIKTSIEDKNPAMRDWPAMRIKEHPHPKTKSKYRVWPLLNFAVAIDDHEMGITHTIRAKDHMDNEKRQKFIYDYFGWNIPNHLYVGRINFKDMKISSSQTKTDIEYGKYEGWDDIRIPFLRALKRRGYQPEAFIKYALDVGVSQNDKYVTEKEFFKTVDAFNKENIDPSSHRFFFIPDPINIKIKNLPKTDIELDLHPDNIKGGRKFNVDENIVVSKEDQKKFKDGDLIRLMDLCNFKKEKNNFVFHSKEYDEYKKSGKMIIHWLPKNETIKINVKMPDGKDISGLAEKNIEKNQINDIVQFERFGFCRKDNKNTFWFTHR
ncbi:glutamate--tRNA ligase [Nanoarchaeota archaeon]